jgi:hypothetical protein
MEKSFKVEVIIFVVGVFAGAYIAHKDGKTTKKEVAIEKVEAQEHKVIIERISPKGTITRKIVVDRKEQAERVVTKKEVIDNTRKTYVGAIAGLQLNDPTPVFGLEINRQFIGPITLGVFGLTNKTFGVTMGLSF